LEGEAVAVEEEAALPEIGEEDVTVAEEMVAVAEEEGEAVAADEDAVGWEPPAKKKGKEEPEEEAVLAVDESEPEVALGADEELAASAAVQPETDDPFAEAIDEPEMVAEEEEAKGKRGGWFKKMLGKKRK
jgi:hypothetical protein